MTRSDLSSVLHDTVTSGWCWIPPALISSPTDIFTDLGMLLPTRKGGDTFYDLRPYSVEKAPLASMSAVTGTNRQPRHTDGAYYPRPPHYIALQCLNAGEALCPTQIWPLDALRLARDRPSILTDPTWITRGGGNTTNAARKQRRRSALPAWSCWSSPPVRTGCRSW